MNKFLHVGCGPLKKNNLKGFQDWDEIRFDIDPKVSPDIVGSLTDMSAAGTGLFDALYSSHNIEHLFPHEVPVAINEFYRVLHNEGFVIITCPDLQSVGAELASGKLVETLYVSNAGPISALDILYGHRDLIANGNHFMAHKSGFTFPVLSSLFHQAGFPQTFGGAIPSKYEIWMIAFKGAPSQLTMEDMAKKFLP